MKIFGSLTNIQAMVFDIDNTCYDNPAYREFTKWGMYNGVGEILGLSAEETAERVRARKKALIAERNTLVTLTDTILSLGLSRQQWHQVRIVALQPQGYIQPDLPLCNLLVEAEMMFRLAFATNSPEIVGRKILGQIGLPESSDAFNIIGADTFEISKPQPEFFLKVCELLGVSPKHCLSIGDREDIDCSPALAADYAGAVFVPEMRAGTAAFLRAYLAGGAPAVQNLVDHGPN
jgi:HAD superfamily hydrolase (TIGR01549 family)